MERRPIKRQTIDERILSATWQTIHDAIKLLSWEQQTNDVNHILSLIETEILKNKP